MVAFPKVGDWVRWISTEAQREGQIVYADWPSFVVKWLGVEQLQTFSWGHVHFGHEHMIADMEIIPEPPRARKIAEQSSRGVLGIDAAAARLGTTPKRVRQLLRDGKLEGRRENGKWAEVLLPTQSTSDS